MVKLKREQIKQMLEELAERPGQSGVFIGLCYDIATPSKRVEYVCPTCGEKTLYVRNKDKSETSEIDIVENLEYLRSRVSEITELSVTLDESEYCRKCNPQVDKPRLKLIIKTEDDSEPRTFYSSDPFSDINLLEEFLSGDDNHKDRSHNVMPLRDCLPRLRKLLGL